MAQSSSSIQSFSYGEHPRQELDVLSPPSAENAPVVVFIHGGGWVHGDKKYFRYIQHRFSKEGVVTVSGNYRLSPEVTFPSFVEDGAHIVSWTAKNIRKFGGDPNHIYLMGHSAGAHTVSLLGLDETYLKKADVDAKCIRGIIPIAAPLMLKASQIPQLRLIFGEAKDQEMWPLAFIDGNEPPFLLLQGNQDPLVQPIHSRVAAKMIAAKGGKVEAHYFEDHDHMSIIRAFSPRHEAKGNVMKPVMALITGK